MAKTRQSLEAYRRKRDFARTPEPDDGSAARPASRAPEPAAGTLAYVIQKHAATRLHYDFRLEWNGVLLSWAVPKGPSFDPAEKRIAIRTEDHPIPYASFEGRIPKGQYGAGDVIVWDRGTWTPEVDVDRGLAEGKLIFTLDGEKLAGRFELVRIQKPGEKQEPWILFKKRGDAWVRPHAEYDVVQALPDSVVAQPLGRLLARSGGGGQAPARVADAAAEVDTAAVLAAAPRAALPAKLSPELATAAASPAAVRGEGWLHEIKFDGYRVLVRIEAGKARLHTRQGHDWTDRMTVLAGAFQQMPVTSGWLDGELVVLGADGTPDFNALQNAFDGRATAAIVCFLFDLPFLDGHDLRKLPLLARRALLAERLAGLDAATAAHLRLSASFEGDAVRVLDSATRMHLEGIVSKRRDSPYRDGVRSDDWLKLKSERRERFLVGGWTDREGSTTQVGSLLLGVRDDDAPLLRWVGNVGTGWDAKTAAAIHARLVTIEQQASPFDPAHAPAAGRWTRKPRGTERWAAPLLVAEVGYAEWTPDGHLRHPLFHALHETEDSVSQQPVAAKTGVARKAAAKKVAAGKVAPAKVAPAKVAPAKTVVATNAVTVTNPQRVIDPSTGLTKLDLVRWYESVAGRMLPHLAGRPVALVRGPTGITGELFFQKHGEKLGIPGLVHLDPALWPGHPPMMTVDSVDALLGCAQMNVIEFHTGNSTVKAIDRPDRMVFDLDPGEGVSWPQVKEGALLVKVLLEELGLPSWLKTSGGKGLHVVVPIDIRKKPALGYDEVKAFSQRVVQHLAKTIPQRFVAKSGGANRVGRIFVDYLRNGATATTVTAFSARARPGLGVSMPIAWDVLPDLKSAAEWTIANARDHLSFETADPWAGYTAAKVSLAKVVDRL